MKHGKKWNNIRKTIDKTKEHTLAEAIAFLKGNSQVKFDETVEIAVKLGIDPKKSDQAVRGSVVLPHGLGKTVRVLVFATGEGAAAARTAGADLVADDDETLKKIEGGFTEFDVAIATPDAMGKVGRLGRVLGPRGLMPNPKAGTVVPPQDLERAIREAKAGRVEFRLDKTANIHVVIGKASFDNKKLYENFVALMDAISKARPAGAKGLYIRRIVVNSTMGPGIKIDPNAALTAEVPE